jgi:Uma2 family endonuclease
MTPQPKRRITEAEYLAFEESSAGKHEYYNGEIYAMSGGTEAHNLISGNTYAALHAQLRRRPCRVYNSDQKIKIVATGLSTYADVAVVCGEAQFAEHRRLLLTNPNLIVEVLSPSTERYDRGMKFQNYRTIPSLQHYILISQSSHRIEYYARQDNGEWLLREAIGLEAQLPIESIDCILALADVYEKVELEAGEEGLPRGEGSD